MYKHFFILAGSCMSVPRKDNSKGYLNGFILIYLILGWGYSSRDVEYTEIAQSHC